MARRKNFFNFNDFNFVDGAIDLFNNTIRNSFEFDAITDDVFEAKVLTTPTPISSDPESFGGIIEGGTFLNKKFSFRVRILGPFSPHRFLEDPCSLDTATTTEEANYIFSLIQSHTQVFLYDNNTATRPKIGDVVKVKLSKSGHSFDTRRAKQYLGIVNEAPKASESAATSALKCEKLDELFEEFDFTTISNPTVNIESAQQLVDTFIDLSLPEIQKLISGIRNIAVGSTIRTTAHGRGMIYNFAKQRGIKTDITSREDAATKPEEVERLRQLLTDRSGPYKMQIAPPEKSDHNPAKGNVAIDLQSTMNSSPSYEEVARAVNQYFDLTNTEELYGFKMIEVREEPDNGSYYCPPADGDPKSPKDPKNPIKCGVVHVALKPIDGYVSTESVVVAESISSPGDAGDDPPDAGSDPSVASSEPTESSTEAIDYDESDEFATSES